jgi:phage-related protein
MGKTVIFYRTDEGNCPVQDFLDSLPGKAAQKVTWVLSLIEDLKVVPATYFKKLTGTEDIWECRIQFGSSAYRVFCFLDGDAVVVLTHGIVKKTQKTPRQEIKRAEAYKRNYLRKGGSHE